MSLQNTQNLVTDLCRDNTQSILLKQYEKNSRFIIVRCTENGVFKKLDNKTMTCKIKVLTPDDRAIYDSCDILDDGTVKVSVSKSMVYASGVAKAELNIIDSSSTALLATMVFNLIIKPSAYSDDKIIASDEFSALTELMTTVEQAVQTVITLETRINEEQVQWEENENTRQTNEAIRQNDEATRQQNESDRQRAESLRESNTSTAISNSNEATSAAIQATEDANTATSNANTATKNANDTNAVAQGLVTQMNEQLETVTQSITDANTATENAQTSANTANAIIEEMNQLKTDLEDAESVRVHSENTRQSNEDIRQQSLNEMEEAITNANTATDRANKAAEDAEAIVLEKIPTISIDFINSLFS